MTGVKAERPTYPIVLFSDDTPTHPLLVVDFEEVKAGKQEAIDTLFKACSNLGFFCTSRMHLPGNTESLTPLLQTSRTMMWSLSPSLLSARIPLIFLRMS